MEIIAAVLIFALVIAGMAVGVIFMNKPITGSCGGLNNLNGGKGKCDVCGASAEEREACQKKAQAAQA